MRLDEITGWKREHTDAGPTDVVAWNGHTIMRFKESGNYSIFENVEPMHGAGTRCWRFIDPVTAQAIIYHLLEGSDAPR